ncbi:MAG TPA: hypothetical protein VGJ00_01875 [Rhabdochlamydiaceae bacterium]|jgi:hypothetical protein
MNNNPRSFEIFPTFSSCIANSHPEKTKHPLLIQPSYSLNGITSSSMDPFILCIEKMLHILLDQDILDALILQKNPSAIKKKINALSKQLPLLHINYPKTAPCTLSVMALCPYEFSNGIGRYLSDTLSHWLVPGKFLTLSCVQSLNFSFIAYPHQKFIFHQALLDIRYAEDLCIVKNNWEALQKEIRLNILAVKQARRILAIKKLSSEQKNAIIQENISSILNRSVNKNTFDHMHHFLLQATLENKLTQIKEQVLPSLEQRPLAFQRDIYSELKYFALLFGEKFTALHELRYVSKLISYQYLFRQSFQRILLSAPNERHLIVKLLKTHVHSPFNESRKVLGIFGAVNLLRENEIFEERHLVQAIKHCISCVRKVENSFILDRRSHDSIRIFYIEIEKKDDTTFTCEEMRELKKHLPSKIKESIEAVIHPVFMPRNEEEIMRNIVILSQQIQYLSDLPQMIISFEEQEEKALVFRIILLRILKDKTPILMDILSASTELQVKDIETKHIGMFRKKHIKEASILKVALNKKKFFRKDFSIDLLKARLAVASELNHLFKGIRDFNGGILSKQQEAFAQLRNLLKDAVVFEDFLLENFFYSLTPPLQQSLVKPSILKALFLLTLEAMDADYKKIPIFLKAQTMEDHILIAIASPSQQLKELLFSIVNTLQIPSSDLSFACVSSHAIHCLSYMYQNNCSTQRNLFYTAIYEGLQKSIQLKSI